MSGDKFRPQRWSAGSVKMTGSKSQATNEFAGRFEYCVKDALARRRWCEEHRCRELSREEIVALEKEMGLVKK